MLIVNHTDLTLAPEYIYITIHKISLVSAPHDIRDPLSLATHIVKLGQITEIM